MTKTENTPPLKNSQLAYQKFVQEAELFFVTKFITGPSIEAKYSFCLDVVFGLDNNPEVDYGRGLLLYSPNYGQGKSFFFDVIEHRCRRIENRNLFKRTSAKELVNYCVENGEDALKDFITVKNLYIDDIGDEGENKTFQIKKSKNMVNVLRAVLLYRYELFVKKGWKTFGTTNLTIEQIAYQYDGRLADRLKQMVHYEELKPFKSNKSFRQYEGTRLLTQVEIDANWAKLAPVEKEPEKPDVNKYLNEIINEDNEYIKNMGWPHWRFIKKYLLEKEIIKETDFVFDWEALQFAELVLRKDTVDYVKFTFKDADREVRIAEKERRLGAINDDALKEMAATIMAKQVFLHLRDQKHQF